MTFALFYSSNLGVERRSLVAFIMTTALVAAVISTSGVSLTYRRAVPNQENRITLNAYVYLTTLLSIFAALLTLLCVVIYSHTKTPIPNTLLFVTLVYAFFASLDFCFHQALIAYNLFKVASILDVLTIVMQISIYLILLFVNQVSIAVALFTALIISYITSTITTLLLLIGIKDPSIKFSGGEIKHLLSQSKNYHLYGISNGFADRIDRIVIAWFLPLGLLGKYAVGTSLISFLRFLPEALSRLIVGKQSLPQIASLNKSLAKRVFVISAIAIMGSLVSQLFVKIVFGQVWILPFLVLLLFAVQEIARGYYQISLSKVVSLGEDKKVRKLSLALIVAAPLLSILGSQLFGIYGVPLGMAFGYILLIFFLKRNKQAI
jgi:O-antigen/teichoic acid export membrane protein